MSDCGGVCSDMSRFTFNIDCGVAILVAAKVADGLRGSESKPDCLPFKVGDRSRITVVACFPKLDGTVN